MNSFVYLVANNASNFVRIAATARRTKVVEWGRPPGLPFPDSATDVPGHATAPTPLLRGSRVVVRSCTG